MPKYNDDYMDDEDMLDEYGVDIPGEGGMERFKPRRKLSDDRPAPSKQKKSRGFRELRKNTRQVQ